MKKCEIIRMIETATSRRVDENIRIYAISVISFKRLDWEFGYHKIV